MLYDSDTIFSDTSSSEDAEEPKTDDPVIGETSNYKKVYAAVRSTPFVENPSKKVKVVKSKKPKKVGKTSKMKKVVKSKKPKKATKKTLKINGFYKKLFKDYPLSTFVPTSPPPSPPFSDGQIDEFQCQHCGMHKELDDETWYACPYAIFHGLIKSGSG